MSNQRIDQKQNRSVRFLTKNDKFEKITIRQHKTAVICHVHYTDLFEELSNYLEVLDDDFDIYISLSEESKEFVPVILKKYPAANILVKENVGRDIDPFLIIFKAIFPMGYETILKLHTKRSPHRSDGNAWRQDMYGKLLGSKANVAAIKKSILGDSRIGIIGPQGHVISYRAYCGASRERVKRLAEAINLSYSEEFDFPFVAGTMFWADPKALEPLTKLPKEVLDFEKEPVIIDGALVHALERFFGFIIKKGEYGVLVSEGNGVLVPPDLTQPYAFTPPSKQLKLRNIRSVVLFSPYDERFAIEHLRITAPYKEAGIDVVQGIIGGEIRYERISQVDAVVFQREFPRDLAAYGRILQVAEEYSKPIIYDLDDLLFDLPEKHPERLSMDYSNALLPMLNALMHADHVIVATERLKETLQEFNENISVLPNYLDDNLWEFKSPKKAKGSQNLVTIGYMGSSSHKPDLVMIAPVLAGLLKEYGDKLNFHIWGTEVPEILEGNPQVIWTPSPTNNYDEFAEYFQTQDADIFMAPLVDNLFNRCKSGLKFLEYSALGAPGVYSNLDGYATIITHGQDGFLADTLNEWRDCLVKLIDDHDLRERVALKAQETVKAKWLLSKNIVSWQSILDSKMPGFNNKTIAKTDSMNLINAISGQLHNLQLAKETLINELNERNAELMNRVNVVTSELEKERKVLEHDRQALEKLEVSYNAKIEEFNALNQKHKEIIKLSEDLRQENQDIKDQIDKAVLEIESLKELLEHNEKTIQVLNEQYEKSEKANEILRLQKEKDTLEIIELKESNSQHINSIQIMNQRLEEGAQEQKRLSGIINERIYQNQVINTELREKVNELEAIKVSRTWKVAVFLWKARGKITPVDGWVSRTLSTTKRFVLRRLKAIKRRLGLWRDMGLIRRSKLFDEEWYLESYPDLKEAGVDPVKHYMYFGGFEGRDPSPRFSSSQYLASYVDVNHSGMNPLVHFLKFGQKEGREIRDSLILLPDQIIIPSKVLSAKKLSLKITQAIKHKEYILSVSHDNYLKIVGGVQLRIIDEQETYLQEDTSYLHIYPYIRRSRLVQQGEPFFIGVNCDGNELGVVTPESLMIVLKRIRPIQIREVHIHHTLGFDLVYLQKLLFHLGIKKAQFWLHDFFSICPGYFLLRNDKQFCGAPNLESNACTICKYCKDRSIQKEEFVNLFNNIEMEVISPSKFALELWKRSFTSLEYTTQIIPHLKLAWNDKKSTSLTKERINVGFIGYPVEHKGWHTWKYLTKEIENDPRYKFLYFSNDWGGHGNFKQILVTVSRDNRSAMQEAIIEKEIDVAFLWSICPETFSFTLYESLSAGCFIITYKDSGNIQDYIMKNPEHGLVLENEDELKKLFQGGRLIELVRSYQKNGMPTAELIFPDEWSK